MFPKERCPIGTSFYDLIDFSFIYILTHRRRRCWTIIGPCLVLCLWIIYFVSIILWQPPRNHHHSRVHQLTIQPVNGYDDTTTTFSGCMPADPANTKIGNPCVWLAGWLSLRVVSLPEENSTIVNGHLNLLQIRYTMPVNCDAPDDMARMIII